MTVKFEMFHNISKITALSCVLLFMVLVATARAGSSMGGAAELSYVDYRAEAEGKEIYSGNTLAQKYSLNWMSTNLFFRSQPRYYVLNLGYEWTSFSTEITDGGHQSKFGQVFGKLRYNGEVGFNPTEQPIRFKAYANNGESTSLKTNIYRGLIDDGLTSNIEGMTKGHVAGFSFAYESDRAFSAAMRQLPRMYLDYKEVVNKSTEIGSLLDNKTTELSVAGLNKENNWLKYRSTKYENYRNSTENSEQQQIQIGLVDMLGRRKWAALTNWINVSADGSYTSKKSNSEGFTEEYDVNFFATATRRNWQARTLMNYSREVDANKITDMARVPVYLKGTWNAETDWYTNISAVRGRELDLSGQKDTLYSNSLSVGGTMFKRSAFTLSPQVTLSNSKQFRGNDAYNIDAGIDTSSTRYFSNTTDLFAGYHIKIKDDGSNTSNSLSWSNTLSLKAQYRPTSRLSMALREELEYGKGTGYLDQGGVNTLSLPSDNQNYAQSTTYASLRYIFSSLLQTSLSGSHTYMKAEMAPASNRFNITHSINYMARDMSYAWSTYYDQSDELTRLNSSVQVQYLPNKYHATTLQSSYDRNTSNSITASEFILKQNYTHNIFSRTGTMRNIATLSEELSFTRNAVDSMTIIDSKSLLLSGRYSPTERVSLYGSVRYTKDLKALTLYYNGGVAVDFKLLSTSLDYYLAKRDIDNRIEKKLSAAVRRSF
jgi:hypothetical protein